MKKKIGVAAFVALMALGLTSALQALPMGNGGVGFDDTYYSDDTFTTAVGGRYMECNSGVSHWGVRTQWVESYAWDCPSYASIADPCPSHMHQCQETNTYQYGYSCQCVG
jgi:hypothetical protein